MAKANRKTFGTDYMFRTIEIPNTTSYNDERMHFYLPHYMSNSIIIYVAPEQLKICCNSKIC